MKMQNLCFLLMTSCLLSACLSGGGYMVANRTSNTTTTLADYNDLTLPKNNSEWEEATRMGLKELVGEYEVVNARGNIVYSIDKVSFHVTDNKAYVLTYMNKKTVPSYKVEFSQCSSLPEDFDQSNQFDVRYIGKPNISCYSSNGEHSRMTLGKTTPKTVARLQREGLVTSLIAAAFSPEYIPVTDPYVMKLSIWGDAGSNPILGLRKIK